VVDEPQEELAEDDGWTPVAVPKPRPIPVKVPVTEDPSELELARQLFTAAYVMTFGFTPPLTTEVALDIAREPGPGLTEQGIAERSKRSVVLFYNQREPSYLLRWMKWWLITFAILPLVGCLFLAITVTLVKRIVLGSWHITLLPVSVVSTLFLVAVAFSLGRIVQRLVWSGWRHSSRLLWEVCSLYLSKRHSRRNAPSHGATAQWRRAR
jgi:hypothetical protein